MNFDEFNKSLNETVEQQKRIDLAKLEKMKIEAAANVYKTKDDAASDLIKIASKQNIKNKYMWHVHYAQTVLIHPTSKLMSEIKNPENRSVARLLYQTWLENQRGKGTIDAIFFDNMYRLIEQNMKYKKMPVQYLRIYIGKQILKDLENLAIIAWEYYKSKPPGKLDFVPSIRI